MTARRRLELSSVSLNTTACFSLQDHLLLPANTRLEVGRSVGILLLIAKANLANKDAVSSSGAAAAASSATSQSPVAAYTCLANPMGERKRKITSILATALHISGHTTNQVLAN